MNNYFKNIETIIAAKKKNDTLGYVNSILQELEKAEKKHPVFPDDIIHQLAIMAEESGEAVRAGLQFIYEDGSKKDIETELMQTAAMCIRILNNIHKVRK